jgi:hypothetical protein
MSFKGQLPLPYGGGTKLFTGVFSITGTGAVTVSPAGSNLAVLDAVACVTNSGTVLPTDVASISSFIGLTVNIVVTNHAAAANAIEAAAKNVAVHAIVG